MLAAGVAEFQDNQVYLCVVNKPDLCSVTDKHFGFGMRKPG
jgi:hypothetical protein